MNAKALESLLHNYLDWYDEKALIAEDLDERHVYAAYAQGYLDALECLLAVAHKNADPGEYEAVPSVYIDDLMRNLTYELQVAGEDELILNRAKLAAKLR